MNTDCPHLPSTRRSPAGLLAATEACVTSQKASDGWELNAEPLKPSAVGETRSTGIGG